MLTIKEILKISLYATLFTFAVLILVDYITLKTEVRTVSFSCEVCNETTK